MPNINFLAIAKDPSAAMVDESSKMTDLYPNTRAVESFGIASNGIPLEISILEPL